MGEVILPNGFQQAEGLKVLQLATPIWLQAENGNAVGAGPVIYFASRCQWKGALVKNRWQSK